MSTTRKTKAAPKKERKPAVKTVKKQSRTPARPKAGGVKKTVDDTGAAAPGMDQIAALAYEIWQQAGCPEGCSDEHWREAEARLRKSGGAGA